MANNKEIASMLTANDVARLLNIHVNTVRRWSNQGKLKSYRIGSRGDRRFQQEDVANFLLSEGTNTNSKKTEDPHLQMSPRE